jgi:hypothetical protein
VRFNVAWANRRQGFYANHHEGAIEWVHNTAFDNAQRNFDMLADEGRAEHYLRNNLAFGAGGTIGNQNDGEIDSASNSWNGGVSVAQDDFQSLSDEGADGPRGTDGALPAIPFLKLAAGSDLIDRGQVLSFPYNDGAPDLGAFETGTPPDAGVASDAGAAQQADAAPAVGSGGMSASAGAGADAGAMPAAGTADTSGPPPGSDPMASAGTTAPGSMPPGVGPVATPTANRASQEAGGCGCRAARARVPRGGAAVLGLLLCAVAWRGWSKRAASRAGSLAHHPASVLLDTSQ